MAAPGEPASQLPGLPRLFFPDQPVPPPPPPPGGIYGQPQPPGQAPGQPQWPASAAPQHPAPPQPKPQPGPQSRPPARQRGARPDRELRQRAAAALVFGVVSLFALLWLGASASRAVYLLLFSVVVGIAGAAIGITALVKANRTGAYRPRGAVGGIVLGAIATVLAGLMLMAFLMYPGPIRSYFRCVQVATTQTAQTACLNGLYHSTGVRP
ncbi:MAG: hypothetical protein M0030_25375 [Actinomycetota bacterium]|nr:hypothetical protein [Actinomycetota bacterium]